MYIYIRINCNKMYWYMYYINIDRCKRVIFRYIIEVGGGGRGRSVFIITVIG